MSFQGRVVAIYTTPEGGKPMELRDEVTAVEGRGLEGDRYCEQAGTYSSRGGSGRHVTLIESEAVLAVRAESGLGIEAADTRRNIVTEGVPLNHLVGLEFMVGDVVLRGMRLCEPCAYLEKMTEAGVREALLHRAGLRAEIVRGGVIRVGDDVGVGTVVSG